MIDTLTERHLLPMMAPAAILRCVGGVDFDSRSSSFFRFGEQLVKKSRPRGVYNAFGKAVVMGHAIDMQILHRYQAKAINDLSAFLVREVVSTELDTNPCSKRSF